MNEEQETLKYRNEAKRLENEAIRLNRGFIKGNLIPVATSAIFTVIPIVVLWYFCIRGTIFDRSGQPGNRDRDMYRDARDYYLDGNLDFAATQAAKILAKQPRHAPANQLMAQIELTRGNRPLAIEYLRHAADGSTNRDEIIQWIQSLEAVR